MYAPLKRPQGVSDGKPAKQATNHPKTRQKRAGSVFTACMSMHAVHSAKIHAIQPGKSCFRRSFHPKTVNGDAIYCVAVKRCRRSRKTGFQHVQESGSSTAGNHVMASRRTTQHTIHRRLCTRVVPRVAATKNNQTGESGLESGRY